MSTYLIPVLIEQDSELPFFIKDIVYCDLSTEEKFKKNIDGLIRALQEPSRIPKHDQGELDRKKMETIKAERELLEIESKRIEQKRAVWMSSILGAFSSIIAAIIATVAFLGTKTESLFPFLKDSAPFIAGVLFGVLSSVIAAYLTRYFQKKSGRKGESQ